MSCSHLMSCSHPSCSHLPTPPAPWNILSIDIFLHYIILIIYGPSRFRRRPGHTPSLHPPFAVPRPTLSCPSFPCRLLLPYLLHSQFLRLVSSTPLCSPPSSPSSVRLVELRHLHARPSSASHTISPR
eukprot:753285-Hanusia_phi.AAC.6